MATAKFVEPNWAFLIRLFINGLKDRDPPREVAVIEAKYIAPWKLATRADGDTMTRLGYQDVPSAMAMGQFISAIGDTNTLSIRAERDPFGFGTGIAEQAYAKGEALHGIWVLVTPTSAVSERRPGRHRNLELMQKATGAVRLTDVRVTRCHVYIQTNSPQEVAMTFEGKEVIFSFD
jgi:hypothetical protein